MVSVLVTVVASTSREPFLAQLPPAPAGGKSYLLDTDDYLTHAKILLGSEDRTAFVQLDFHTEYSMVTGMDCDGCVV